MLRKFSPLDVKIAFNTWAIVVDSNNIILAFYPYEMGKDPSLLKGNGWCRSKDKNIPIKGWDESRISGSYSNGRENSYACSRWWWDLHLEFRIGV